MINRYSYKILEVITGVDTVISTLGPPLKRKYNNFAVLEGHKNIVKAMRNVQLKRFITIATPSVKSSDDQPSMLTLIPPLMAKVFFPSAYKEIVQLGEIVKNSKLDWIIVRFIAPNNKPQSGQIKLTFGKEKIGWGISRSDIADFLYSQMTDNQYIGLMPIIGS